MGNLPVYSTTLFQKTPFKGKCALVTSYNPQAQDITREDTGANTETDKEFIYNTYTELLKDVAARPGMTRTETYEEWAKALFINEPAHMKLLIVVDKLLTGFDAPPCTYLYIDKSMQDHGLFQAVCRTNRLDGEDKPAFKGSECPCRFFGLRALHTTKSRGPVRHRPADAGVEHQRAARPLAHLSIIGPVPLMQTRPIPPPPLGLLSGLCCLGSAGHVYVGPDGPVSGSRCRRASPAPSAWLTLRSVRASPATRERSPQAS